jgi:glycine cleavage system H protein
LEDRLIRQPCIWMSAGLVRYRLCDREFDCESCPLDAALRGAACWPAVDDERRTGTLAPFAFPADRLYSRGHCWLQPLDPGRSQVGIDALAAALLGRPGGLHSAHDGPAVAADEVVASLDFPHGSIPLAAPAAGVLLRLNDAARRSPRLVAEDPYGAGWIYELREDGGRAELCGATDALERARLDLRHFGRRAALGLLAGIDAIGATMADGGEGLTDLRHMLGPRRYLALVRDLLR